ncbi:MAG TPA: hypothetical protein PK504_01665 [Ferruginibacter sp.]|nr:hypothetical protein [Ferruginibacter sp.]HRE62821.1 hypothetical protein [Ferruginibacter sp.]
MQNNKLLKTSAATFITSQEIAAMAAFLKAFQLKEAVRKIKLKKENSSITPNIKSRSNSGFIIYGYTKVT